MSKSSHPLIGFLLGAVFGALLGVGELQFVKKSMRGEILPYAVGGTALICAFIGLSKGRSLAEEDKQNESLGLFSQNEKFYKDGKYWVGFTEWTNPTNNKTYKLYTARSNKKVIVTVLSDQIIINHEVEGANQNNILKLHKKAKLQVFAEIKEKGDWVSAGIGKVEYDN